jgi:DNA repair exonuclease SbcCD nuclease subunit
MDRAAEDPLAGFERGPEPGVHIGLLRGSYDDAALSACGLDYWALGGTLERRIARQESPWIVSPGSVCGRSFRRDERGPRGATVVHVAGGKVAGVDFAPLAPVELVVLEARASDVLPALESGQPGGGTARDAWIGAVCDRLERQLVDLDSPEAPLVLVRAVLSGQFAGSHRLGRSAEEEHRSAEEVLEQLRARAARAQIADGARARTLWWDSIEVDLWPDLDREELLRRGDLAADLVRIAAGYGEDERALAAELERRAAPLRKRELGRLLRPLEEKGRLKLLRRAEREAHRLLEQEEVV